MDHASSNVSDLLVFEYAVGALVRRSALSTLAAGVTLVDAADRLGVSLADLAELVLATEPGAPSGLKRLDRAWTLRGPLAGATGSWAHRATGVGDGEVRGRPR